MFATAWCAATKHPSPYPSQARTTRSPNTPPHVCGASSSTHSVPSRCPLAASSGADAYSDSPSVAHSWHAVRSSSVVLVCTCWPAGPDACFPIHGAVHVHSRTSLKAPSQARTSVSGPLLWQCQGQPAMHHAIGPRGRPVEETSQQHLRQTQTSGATRSRAGTAPSRKITQEHGITATVRPLRPS
jgi:hypothetical protein